MKKLFFASLMLVPALVLAHPGTLVHNTADFFAGFLHPLTGLDHIAAMIAVGMWAAQEKGRALWSMPMFFVSMMVAGGLWKFFGLPLKGVESGILASVLVFALLVVRNEKIPLRFGNMLAAVFGIFHGYVHVSEMGAAQILLYSGGFVSATLLLHGAGIVLGLMSLRQARGPVASEGHARHDGAASASPVPPLAGHSAVASLARHAPGGAASPLKNLTPLVRLDFPRHHS